MILRESEHSVEGKIYTQNRGNNRRVKNRIVRTSHQIVLE